MSLGERLRRLFTRPPRHPVQEGNRWVLLTGSAGHIGLSMRELIGDDFNFRCFDRRPSPGCVDARQGDIGDAAAVHAAMAGVEAVLHLASSHYADWQEIQTREIGGTYNLFEAARQAGVRKFIFASTNHVSGWLEKERVDPIDAGMPVRPDSLFAVGKACGEVLGQYYADRYGMTVICLRIGSYRSKPKAKELHRRVGRTWCSTADLAQLVRRCLEQELSGFHVFYGVSYNTGRFWDISNAQRLVGYHPRDNAADLLP